MSRTQSDKLPIVGLVLLALVVGFIARDMLRREQRPQLAHDQHPSSDAVQQTAEVWTCAMHPQIRLPKPGERYFALGRVESVNALPPEKMRKRIPFAHRQRHVV